MPYLLTATGATPISTTYSWGKPKRCRTSSPSAAPGADRVSLCCVRAHLGALLIEFAMRTRSSSCRGVTSIRPRSIADVGPLLTRNISVLLLKNQPHAPGVRSREIRSTGTGTDAAKIRSRVGRRTDLAQRWDEPPSTQQLKMPGNTLEARKSF